ncbi:MAG: 2-hydroxychromene-2-carboxylate isomerase [Accumulibacter sp.]|jgi:2-hydroxychromene-2-carboxylate isomerase|uniref:2-hydroxychromene-2-carboxylate isomerase n=1 Tax=Accumulibacter sp. TaxID=2053492 RepID=UPI003315EEFC
MSQPIEATASLAPVEFYFDFTSPYGYLASEKIDALAARYDRRVKWRPFLMGVALKATGAGILTRLPLKGEYALRDFARSARFLDVPYTQPANFPLATMQAARAYYWLHDRDCATARAFAHSLYRGYFIDGRDISDPEVVLELAARHGADRATLAAALNDAPLKERLKAECEAAIARGVFGSPYLIVDDEPFFGVDRLPQLERWLASGGF